MKGLAKIPLFVITMQLSLTCAMSQELNTHVYQQSHIEQLGQTLYDEAGVKRAIHSYFDESNSSYVYLPDGIEIQTQYVFKYSLNSVSEKIAILEESAELGTGWHKLRYFNFAGKEIVCDKSLSLIGAGSSLKVTKDGSVVIAGAVNSGGPNVLHFMNKEGKVLWIDTLGYRQLVYETDIVNEKYLYVLSYSVQKGETSVEIREINNGSLAFKAVFDKLIFKNNLEKEEIFSFFSDDYKYTLDISDANFPLKEYRLNSTLKERLSGGVIWYYIPSHNYYLTVSPDKKFIALVNDAGKIITHTELPEGISRSTIHLFRSPINNYLGLATPDTLIKISYQK